MCLKKYKFVCIPLRNNNVRANDGMLINFKNVAHDHTSVCFFFCNSSAVFTSFAVASFYFN